MQGPMRIAAAACAAVAIFVGGVAQAGNGFLFQPFVSKVVLDRPDLLNFDPFSRTGGNTYNYTFAFTAMGEDYTTTFPSYSYYGPSYFELRCFDDPDDKKMLVDNVLCFRAGARRVSATDVSYLLYDNYTDTSFGFPVFDYDALYAQLEGGFGQKVYIEGFARVMTDDGSEVELEYSAGIPDRLKRNRKKIKFTQSAWVDVEGIIWESEGESLDFVSSFEGWFEGCEFTGSAKGTAFEDGKSSNGMEPVAKPGTLEKGKGKLKCDKDATALITSKISDRAEGNTAAVEIWTSVLDKLGSTKKLKLKVNKKGLEVVETDQPPTS
jgi:hypothetical protein